MPEYKRASIFTPYQNEILDAMSQLRQNVRILGDRRTSKTLLCSVAACELLIKQKGKVFIAGPTYERAHRNLDVLYENNAVFKSIEPFIQKRSRDTLYFTNGSELSIKMSEDILVYIADEKPVFDEKFPFLVWTIQTPTQHQTNLKGFKEFIIRDKDAPWITNSPSLTCSRLEMLYGETFKQTEEKLL